MPIPIGGRAKHKIDVGEGPDEGEEDAEADREAADELRVAQVIG